MRKMKIPKAPSSLSASEVKLYNTTCQYLGELGHLRTLDGYMVSLFVQSWTLYEEYRDKSRAEGEIQQFQSGATNVSAAYTVMERERAVLMKLSGKLGLTPQDRAKIKDFANEQDGQDDMYFEAFKDL